MQRTNNKALGVLFILILTLTSQTAFAQAKTSSSAFEIKNESLKEYLGQYDPDGSSQYFSVTISLDGDDRLMAQPTDKSEPNTLMVASKKDHFNLRGTPLKISFQRDESDKIISLTLTQGSQSFTAKKAKTP